MLSNEYLQYQARLQAVQEHASSNGSAPASEKQPVTNDQAAEKQQNGTADYGAPHARNFAVNGQVRRLGTTTPAPTDPMAVARRFVWANYEESRQAPARGSIAALRYWRGAWMAWENGCWREHDNTAIVSNLYAALEGAQYQTTGSGDVPELKPWRPNRRSIGDALEALKAISHLRSSVTAPSWLDPAAGYSSVVPSDLIACRNGLLNARTRALLPHTPEFFNLSCVPFDWDPAAPPPWRWLQFLNQLWPDDPQAIATLQQFFGYVLSGRTDLQKMLLITGPTRSGKGTIARILAALVGESNHIGPTLAGLGTNFGLAPLLSKSLAVVSDARLPTSSELQSQILERLLSISGEDTLTVDRKHREVWTGRLPTRIMVLSNELPRFSDPSGAIASRFVILALMQSWLSREDQGLFGGLCEELPGILAWSLDGLDALRAVGRFIEPESSQDSRRDLAELTSPIEAFITEHCVTGPTREIPVKALYAAWAAWSELNGYQRPGSAQTFARELRSALPTVRTERPRTKDGRRERVHHGIALNPDVPAPNAYAGLGLVPPAAPVPPPAVRCGHNLASPCPVCAAGSLGGA